jgi:hypothetical protein
MRSTQSIIFQSKKSSFSFSKQSVNISELQLKNEEEKNDEKVKGYQATTISMSRKNSVKTLGSSKSSGKFQSFLRKPTQLRNNRNNTQKLRLARSNDTHNTSKASETSTRQNKVLRKRRKQPSESIDSSRNMQTRNGATLRMFSNCLNTKRNQSFTNTIVCHRKYETNASQTRKINVSHTELNPKILPKKANNSNLMNTSKSFAKPEQSVGMKSLWEKRAFGISRPKTSMGRNNSLYNNSNKYNLS